MKRFWIAICIFLAAELVHGAESGQAAAAQVGSAQSAWKGTKASAAQGETLCIGVCDPREFSGGGHKTVQADLWETTSHGEACSDALNYGLYAQDIGEFYKAEAHFDNCAVEESLEYLQKLKASAEDLMLLARKTWRQDGNQTKLLKNVKKAVREYGRALHIVQDFYAHTNYIDLMAAEHVADSSPTLVALRQRSVTFSDKLALQIWTAEGVKVVRDLQSEAGLVSGTVFYETPRLNRCSPDSPTHGQLAKDAADKGNGASATRWTGISHHQAAITLAKKSTRDFIQDLEKVWPELAGACGKYIRVLQVSDERDFNTR